MVLVSPREKNARNVISDQFPKKSHMVTRKSFFFYVLKNIILVSFFELFGIIEIAKYDSLLR